MTATLTCPGCGAAAAPDATTCAYCHAALVQVACPSCFGALFQGMQFCPHCGTRASRTVEEDKREARCPGCKTVMQRVQVSTTELHECPSCASSWLSTETFEALSAGREERGAVAAIVGAIPARAAPSAESIHYHPCPVCAKLMNRTNFAHGSGIILDVCRGHGVWFESRELAQVLEFIAGGGLDRARASG
jgi:Zn-finger nucleic acid-binding protein